MYNKLKNIIPHKVKFDNYSARLLEKADVSLVQKFFEENSDFFNLCNGKNPEKNEAETVFSMLPEGRTLDDKFLVGLFDGNKLIAFIDMIQNYKTDGQWSVGLYIIDVNYRGKHLGAELLEKLEDLLMSLKATSLSIVVNEQNQKAMSFWKNKGFVEESKRKQKYFPDKDEFIMFKKLEKREPTVEEKYFKNGKLINFPSKPIEQKEIYKIMAGWFENGKKYSEMQVNEILKSRIETRDHVTLRRDLVDGGFLSRSSDGKEYEKI